MIMRFTVLGEPQGKGRPKFSARNGMAIARTPDKTVFYENLIRTEFRQQCGDMRFADTDNLDLRVRAYYTIAKSTSKKKQALMLNQSIRPTKKPDADNILKVVADSLNNIAYKDDAQIVDIMLRKFYSDRPRLEIMISESKTKNEEVKENDEG